MNSLPALVCQLPLSALLLFTSAEQKLGRTLQVLKRAGLRGCRGSSAGKLFWGMSCMGEKDVWVLHLEVALTS